jgi:hypothetical protein
VRLPIDLLMEVESQPPVRRVGGEGENQRHGGHSSKAHDLRRANEQNTHERGRGWGL